MKRKWISVVMACVCLLMCFVPAADAAEPTTQYDAAAAVSYAAAEWDSGVGVCDQFVKACLAVGGVDIRAGGVDPVRNALLDAGFGTQCELVISADGVHALQSENPGVRAGDVLFFYCEECEKSIHTVMIAGYDADGILYTYGHNPGWDKVDWIGSFRHTPDGGEPHAGCYKYYVVKMTDEPFHAHSFSATDKYESVHPHEMYTDCSCGAKYYLGWNARVSSCTVCNPPLDSKPIATATADLTAGKIVVRWSTVQNATGYALLRAKESPSATYFQIYPYPSGTVMSTSCANSSVELGKTYYYKVVATLADGSTVESEPVRCYMGKEIAAPEASVELNSSMRPRVMWEAVTGATRYEVYAAGSENGSYTKLYQTTGLRFVHGGAKPGKEYWYKVVALDDTGLASVQSAAVSVTVPDATMEPPMAGLCWNGSGKPMIVWNAVAGADHYEVYCWSAGNPGGVCIARTTGVQFTHTNASAGEGYVYRVRAVNSSTGIGAYSDPVVIR